MTQQKLKRIGRYAYPIPPLAASGKSIHLSLGEGGDGHVALGTHAFPLTGGESRIVFSGIPDGVYTLHLCMGDERVESDPIRIAEGEGYFLLPDRNRLAKERIDSALLEATVKEQVDAIRRLEDAVFRTTIF